jgi:hypothetical protein
MLASLAAQITMFRNMDVKTKQIPARQAVRRVFYHFYDKSAVKNLASM